MKIVLIYPKFPDTFWSFKYALKFISKKSTQPPLGLLTVAAMLPKNWDKKLIDMNIAALEDKDLEGADFVFLSAMVIQRQSVKEVIKKCKKMGIKIVAGGPLFTIEYEEFKDVDYLILNEAEITFPLFLEDWKYGCAKHIYTTSEFADITRTPIPLWDLVKMRKYVSMSIQYSRGCPFDCEFCDIINLFGHQVRTKNRDQVLAELEKLHSCGWRGEVFFVDDNFISNKIKLKNEILPAIIAWMKEKRYPFSFGTQASINLSDDKELMRLMAEAGFDSVFVGIETIDENSLAECNKFQNKNRDFTACVKKIQQFGMQVQGSFIVGFDSDSTSIFDQMIEFIKNSGIVTAMVGLLNAPKGTKLYQRLVKEDRMLKNFSGDNTNFSTNFIPKMNYETLLGGYKKIIGEIYAPKYYYERVKKFLKEYQARRKFYFHPRCLYLHFGYSVVLFKSIWVLGVKDEARIYYWKLFFRSLFSRPRLFPLAITLAIYGFHFRKVFKNYLATI